MIDRQGFRPNVGIILCNDAGKLFWARRIGEDAWQFPQGGILADETPEEAVFRELAEEVGLKPNDVQLIGRTASWLRYRIPKRFLRFHPRRSARYVGQKQIWFLLKLVNQNAAVCLDKCDKPEFDSWTWINYEETVSQVVSFKRVVYRKALQELIPLIQPIGASKLAEQLKHR